MKGKTQCQFTETKTPTCINLEAENIFIAPPEVNPPWRIGSKLPQTLPGEKLLCASAVYGKSVTHPKNKNHYRPDWTKIKNK